MIGGGGGCIELAGKPCIPSCISSIEPNTWLPFKSLSCTAWPASLGVSGSELGGDTYDPVSMPSMGNVWLRGRWGGYAVPGADTEGIRLGSWLLCVMYGEATSGEAKKGLGGDWGPGENVVEPPSLKALAREALLNEWYGLWFAKKSTCWLRSGDSLFTRSLSVTGVDSFVGGGDVGEMLGVCVPDGGALASLSSARLFFRDFAPMRLFFCLNFSSHEDELAALMCCSELPTVREKWCSFSLIRASLIGSPCFWWFLAQLASARSISGNLPFGLRAGERLPSS